MKPWTWLVVGAMVLGMGLSVRAQQAPPSVPIRDPQVAADFEQQITLLQRYIEVVREFDKLASDPASSGVAAVIGAKSIVEKRGTNAAIKYFTELLPEVQNPSVQRAIRLQLVDLYKSSGQDEQALEHLHYLITTAPPQANAVQP